MGEADQILQEIRDDVRAVRSEMTSMLIQVTALSEWRKAMEKAETERTRIEDRLDAERSGAVKDLDQRIQKIEKDRSWVLGAAAAIALVAGAVGAFLMKLVGK